MKKCATCHQIFSDDNDFCPDDGAILVADSGSQGFGGFPASGEMPTQFVPRPTQDVRPATQNTNIQSLVIGVLATALVSVGLYLFLSRDSGNQMSDSKGNASTTNSAANTQPSPSPVVVATPPETRTSGSPSAQPVVEPYVSPAGKWQGQWTNGKGSVFGQTFTLVDDGNGKISGQVVHTLQQTINPQKMGKIGLTAVEYVQGTYDPNTRIIMLSGIRKNDPNDLIILDKYRLSVSASNSILAGETFGGKSRGQVSLRR